MVTTPPTADIDSPEAAASFREFVRRKAAANAPISYRDEQGRLIEEWPATGEKWEIGLDKVGNSTRLVRLA